MKWSEYKLRDALQRARISAGYTQEKVSDLLSEKLGKENFSVKNIRNWEQGRVQPPLKELLALCDIYGCDLDYLVGNIDHKTHDASFICEYTGLSEQAVSKLHTWRKKFAAGHSLTLSQIIESKDSGTLLSRIRNYLTRPDPKHGTVEEHDIKMETGRPSAAEVSLWSASHAFTSCLESIRKKCQI